VCARPVHLQLILQSQNPMQSFDWPKPLLNIFMLVFTILCLPRSFTSSLSCRGSHQQQHAYSSRMAEEQAAVGT
jgi:hypothetical protein